jgi:hypothetical protein
MMRTPRFIGICFCVCLVLLTTGCELFNTDPQFKEKKSTKKLPPWVCTQVLEADRYVFEARGQVVTVSLAHVLLPTEGENANNALIRSRTELSKHKLEAVAREVEEVVKETLDQKHCTLLPPPRPGQSEMAAVVKLASGIDFNGFLIKFGLALIDPASGTNLPDLYTDNQRRAVDFGKGIWSAPIRVDKRFILEYSTLLRRYEEGNTYNVPDTLRRFHSPDLIRAPRYVADGNNESESGVDMVCAATVTIIAIGPPKEYDLTVSFRPKVLANEYSGPLKSFKPIEQDWKKDGLYLRGGETNTITIAYESLEITRTVRGANVEIYSGYLITGYEIKITSEEKEIYKAAGTCDKELTLKELKASSSGLF